MAFKTYAAMRESSNDVGCVLNERKSRKKRNKNLYMGGEIN